MKKSISLITVSFLLFFAATASAGTLKIGYMATMSGPAASLGVDILDGFKLGLTHSGGTLGGQEVEIVVGDDQLKPNVGVQVATRLIEKDKVDMITSLG